MTRRAGAYGRRAGNVPPPVAVGPVARYGVNEGWRVYAMTSNGVLFVPCTGSEAHARKVAAMWRSLHDRAITDTGYRVHVGGMILDPDDEVAEAWGQEFVPTAPRWRALARSQGWSWCAGCPAPLWPYRLTLDGRCSDCVRDGEVGDPRPVWPQDSAIPVVREWPKAFRTAATARLVGLTSWPMAEKRDKAKTTA
jgi:hypothetical protein